MKKKRFIIIAVAVLLVIAAAVICFKMFGGSHTGCLLYTSDAADE